MKVKKISLFVVCVFLSASNLAAFCLDDGLGRSPHQTTDYASVSQQKLGLELYKLVSVQRLQILELIDQENFLESEGKNRHSSCALDFVRLDSEISASILRDCNLSYQQLDSYPSLLKKIEELPKACNMKGFKLLFTEYLDSFFNPLTRSVVRESLKSETSYFQNESSYFSGELRPNSKLSEKPSEVSPSIRSRFLQKHKYSF
ncbi:MAG: hypothetical protein VX642_12270 [Bdellovibrionota bacterium]|nr:hypothetical protein [Bdellovibrionota bacterium]